MAWRVSGFRGGEIVELREPGERIFYDDPGTIALYPVSTSAPADPAGVVTLDPSPPVKGIAATGQTSGRRVVARAVD